MKRLLPLLMIIFLIATINTPILANDIVSTEADTMSKETNSSIRFNESIEFLKSVGILPEDDNYKAEDAVKRGELAVVISKYIGIEDVLEKVSTPFFDIAESHPQSGYIAAVYAAGIMRGNTDGTFSPDENVTYNQAVKTIVSALGYELRAESLGGYPSGWNIVASDLGILINTKTEGENPINWEVFSELLRNATKANLMIKTGYGTNKKYEVFKGRTILTEYFNIQIIEGQITANHFTTLAGSSNLSSDEVQVGDIILKVGKTNAASLLGRKLTLYTKENKREHTEKTIVFIEDAPRRNHTLSIDSMDISPNTSVSALHYIGENARETYVNIESGAYLIYNGKAKVAWSESDLIDIYGDVELLDTDGSGTYDIIFVYDYKNLIIENVDVTRNIIYLKSRVDGLNLLDLDSSGNIRKTLLVKSDGSLDSVADYATGDVLSVAMSEDESVIKVIRNNQNITGLIEGISDDELEISGKSYKIRYNEEPSIFEIGKEGTFYIDFKGAIIGVGDSKISNRKYGYLVEAGIEGGISKTPQFKIFTDGGVMSYFKGANKLTFNNELLKQSSEILNSHLIYINNKAVRQLILYGLDSEGNINYVETAKDSRGIGNVEDRMSVFTNDGNWGSVSYRDGNMSLIASRYIVSAETKVFVIPDSDNLENDKLYRIVRVSNLRNQAYKDVNIYDVDLDNRIAAMTLRNEEALYLNNYSTRGVVTKVTKGLNSAGELITMVYVFEEGEEVAYSASDTLKANLSTAITDINTETEVQGGTGDQRVLKSQIPVDKLKKGDVIQYSAISGGRFDAIRVLLRASTPIESEKMGSGTLSVDNNYAGLFYAYGIVDSVLKDGMRVYMPTGIEGNQAIERVYVYGTARIVEYDSQMERAREISKDEIFPGDRIFVSNSERSPRLIVVYK